MWEEIMDKEQKEEKGQRDETEPGDRVGRRDGSPVWQLIWV